MQIKNKINFSIIFFLIFFLFNYNLYAEEFNITAKEVLVDKENEILIGKGSVTAEDLEGKIVNADKITYEKLREFLLAEGNVKISDLEGNILITDKATYDKKNNIIITYDNTELIIKSKDNINKAALLYFLIRKILKIKKIERKYGIRS